MSKAGTKLQRIGLLCNEFRASQIQKHRSHMVTGIIPLFMVEAFEYPIQANKGQYRSFRAQMR